MNDKIINFKSYKDNDLYDNLDKLLNLGEFVITSENGDVKLPTKITLEKGKYMAVYNATLHDYLSPFRILFYNTLDYHKNDYNATIDNIRKTDKYTGSQIVETVLYFLKNIGVKRVIIGDDVHRDCNGRRVDLSFYLLLDRGMTYYQRFGFKMRLRKNSIQWAVFGTQNKMMKALNTGLKKFSKLTIKEFLDGYIKALKLMVQVIIEQGYHLLRVTRYNKGFGYDFVVEDPGESMTYYVESRIKASIYMINILSEAVKKNPKMSLRDFLLDSFYNDCGAYSEILASFIYGRVYKLEYKKIVLTNKYVDVFQTLYLIRQCNLELTF